MPWESPSIPAPHSRPPSGGLRRSSSGERICSVKCAKPDCLSLTTLLIQRIGALFVPFPGSFFARGWMEAIADDIVGRIIPLHAMPIWRQHPRPVIDAHRQVAALLRREGRQSHCTGIYVRNQLHAVARTQASEVAEKPLQDFRIEIIAFICHGMKIMGLSEDGGKDLALAGPPHGCNVIGYA